MTESSATSTESVFLSFLPGQLQDAAAALTVVPASLARLGCDSIKLLALRQVDHLRDLGNVSDLLGLAECQARFTQTLWDDQQRAVQQVVAILRLDRVERADVDRNLADRETASEAVVEPAVRAPEQRSARDVARKAPSKAAGRKRTRGSRRNRSGTAERLSGATFELFVDEAGDHRFRLKADVGTVLLVSMPYKSRASAVNGINVVRKNAANDDRYVTAQGRGGGRKFELRAGNRRVISSSRPFPSAAKMQAAMAMVKRVAESARIAPD